MNKLQAIVNNNYSKGKIYSFCIFIFIVLSAGCCGYYSPSDHMREIQIWVNPSPIILKDNSAPFNLSIISPYHKQLLQLDSIIYKIEIEKKSGELIIENILKLIPTKQESNTEPFRLSKTFNNFINADSDTLTVYFTEIFYKNGNWLNTERLPIDYVIKEPN